MRGRGEREGGRKGGREEGRGGDMGAAYVRTYIHAWVGDGIGQTSQNAYTCKELGVCGGEQKLNTQSAVSVDAWAIHGTNDVEVL